MESCYSVELGADDAALDLPWDDPDDRVHYFDTQSDPALVTEIPEAKDNPELQRFLLRANSPPSAFVSAKCDVWITDDLEGDQLEYEHIVFKATMKFGGYVDLVFTDERRYDFSAHESFAREFAKRVRMADDIAATSELIVRRLHERRPSVARHDAFYFTLYVFGFGSQDGEAQGQWAHAMNIVGDALFG
jgi:hypothetical protein